MTLGIDLGTTRTSVAMVAPLGSKRVLVWGHRGSEASGWADDTVCRSNRS